MLESLSSGFLLIYHTLLFFLAVSIIFSDSLVPVERFALLFLKFPGLFRSVGISFSLRSLEQSGLLLFLEFPSPFGAVSVISSNALVPFCFRLLIFQKFCSPFQSVSIIFATAPLAFERFAAPLFSQTLQALEQIEEDEHQVCPNQTRMQLQIIHR